MGLLDDLRQFSNELGPTEEERRRQLRESALTAGIAALGARKGYLAQDLSRAGLLGVTDYNQGLRDSGTDKLKRLAIAQQLAQWQQQQAQLAEQQRQQEAIQGAIKQNTVPGLPQMGPPTAAGEMQPGTPSQFNMQGFAKSLEGVDPFKAVQLQSMLAKEVPFDKPKPEHYTPESLASYARSGNIADLKMIGPKNEGAWVDAGERNGQFWQRNTVTNEVRAVGSRPPVTNVHLPPMQGAEDVEVGKARGQRFVQYQTEAKNAAGKVRDLGALETLLAGVDTNSLTPVGMKVAGTARALGIEIDPNLPAKQAAETIVNKMALEARSTAEGGGMPGAMSDADREFLLRSVPNLTQTPQGRKAIIEVQRRIGRRAQEVAALANMYRKKTGTFDEGFQEFAAQYFADKPLFSDLQGLANSGSAPAAKGGFKILGTVP